MDALILRNPYHGPVGKFTDKDRDVGQSGRVPALKRVDKLPDGHAPGLKAVPFEVAEDGRVDELLSETAENAHTIEDVPISSIVSKRRSVNPDITKGYVDRPPRRLNREPKTTDVIHGVAVIPFAVEHEGKHYIADGTHRAVAAWARGAKTLQVIKRSTAKTHRQKLADMMLRETKEGEPWSEVAKRAWDTRGRSEDFEKQQRSESSRSESSRPMRPVIERLSPRMRENAEKWQEETGNTREVMAKRVQALFDRASKEQIQAGEKWYPVAHAEAKRMASDYGVTTEQAAGVIAALSPLREWSENLTNAKDVLRSVVNGEAAPEVQKLLSANVAKAKAILKGRDPQDVLWSGESGFKVRSFYSNIVNPDARDVTIDTHILRVLLDDNSISSKEHGTYAANAGRYDAFRQAFLDVADKVKMSPAAVQATVWTVQKDEHPKRSDIGKRLKKVSLGEFEDRLLAIMLDALAVLFQDEAEEEDESDVSLDDRTPEERSQAAYKAWDTRGRKNQSPEDARKTIKSVVGKGRPSIDALSTMPEAKVDKLREAYGVLKETGTKAEQMSATAVLQAINHLRPKADPEAEEKHYQRVGEVLDKLIAEHGPDWLGALAKLSTKEQRDLLKVADGRKSLSYRPKMLLLSLELQYGEAFHLMRETKEGESWSDVAKRAWDTRGRSKAEDDLQKQADAGIERIEKLVEKVAESDPVEYSPDEDDTDAISEVELEWDDIPNDAQSDAYSKFQNEAFENGIDVDTTDLLKEIEQDTRRDNDEVIKSTERMTLEDLDQAFPDPNPAFEGMSLYKKLDPETIEVGDDEGEGAIVDTDALRFKDGSELTESEKDKVSETWNDHYGDFIDKAIEEAQQSDSYYEQLSELESEAIHSEWYNKSDSEKLEYVNDDTKLEAQTEKYVSDQGGVSDGMMPSKWAIDREEVGAEDGARIRAISQQLARDRTVEILKERQIYGDTATDKGLATVAEARAETTWHEWKRSSTSDGGKALQLAAAEELGGVHRYSKEEVDQIRASVPGGEQGYATLKAYVRAQWETTQFIMKKSGKDDIEIYRGMMLSGDDIAKTTVERVGREVKGDDGKVQAMSLVGQRLSEIELKRNGAASTTMTPGVANSWGGVGNLPPNPKRVVLRFKVPRTAVLSIPVFGQNVHSEKEVVLIGTQGDWEWDAWLDKAPSTKDVPILTKKKAA